MNPTLLLALALSASPGPDTWPGFRGDGSSRAAGKLPEKWSPTENIAWRVGTPGYGQSAPVVWKGNVYVTSVEGEQKEKLYVACFAAADGKKKWAKTFDATQKGKNNPMMSRAAGTPAADADGVYALFESGDLIALSHAGEVRWERHFAKEFGELKNNHGLGSSPGQTASAVIVLLDHQGPSKLLAVRKADGKDVWVADRPARSSWTSPVVVKVGDAEQVVASSGGAVTGYDAAKGKQLWEMTGVVGNSIPSATFDGAAVFVAAGENRMKPDADATSKSNCRIDLTGSGDGYAVAWRAKKLATGTASPLVFAGHAYFVDKSGFVSCLDAKTGEEKYRERLDNQQWATPIAAGDRVYFFGKDGVTTVLKAGATHDPVGSFRLWSEADFAKKKEEAKKSAALPKPPEGKGPGGGAPLPKEELDATRYSAVGDVVYGAAAVDGAIFLRTGNELFCIRAGE